MHAIGMAEYWYCMCADYAGAYTIYILATIPASVSMSCHHFSCNLYVQQTMLCSLWLLMAEVVVIQATRILLCLYSGQAAAHVLTRTDLDLLKSLKSTE